MEKIYFTITGCSHYYGYEFMKEKMIVRLVKDHDNEFDKEAIRVELDGLGIIGYVSNSPYSVLGESMSAGRLYDRINETAYGEVLYVLDKGIVCLLSA